MKGHSFRISFVVSAVGLSIVSTLAGAIPTAPGTLGWGRDVNRDGAVDAVLLNPDGSVARVVWLGGFDVPVAEGIDANYYVTGYNSDGWLAGNVFFDALGFGPVLWDPQGRLHVMPPRGVGPSIGGLGDGLSHDMTEAGWICMSFMTPGHIEYNVHTGAVVEVDHRDGHPALPCGENDPATRWEPFPDDPNLPPDNPPDKLHGHFALGPGEVQRLAEPSTIWLASLLVPILVAARRRMGSREASRARLVTQRSDSI